MEELNGQVANLAAENVRLRASEISLAAQLKKERKRNNHIVQQAEHVVSPYYKPPASDIHVYTGWLPHAPPGKHAGFPGSTHTRRYTDWFYL